MSHNYEEAYRQGHEYNELVAAYLKRNGIDCEVPELEIAERPEDWSKFTNNEKDIILGTGEVLEVKSINQNFTGDPSSWPMPRAIVDTYSGYHGKKTRPLAYVFVSQQTKQMLAISTEKPSKNWVVERKYDKYRNKEDDFYFAPKGELRPIDKLVNYLKGRNEALKD